MGRRIAFRHDEDADTDVDDEKWAHVVYDERWRMIAVYHQDDDDPTDAPKERFVYHAAGANGSGGSSYIDDTILRDRDHNTAWAAASDGTLERRDFHCQNWRADVIALVEPDTYDVFNRLVAVKTTDTTPVEVGQYRYNGLGQRIAFRHDEDADIDVDDEKWANVVYDERWRMIAVYHQDDDDPTDAPKERFVYHAAGANGSGSSSYIDDTILRDRDHNTAWATASDGTLERRDFHCQNWRADVIALVEPDADIVEHVRYGLSGEPFAISPADVTYAATNPSSGLGVPNGVVDNGGDYSHYLNMYTAGTDPRADFNHDGTIDSGDFFAYLGKHTADTGKDWGPGVLSGVQSRKGYAGYERDRAAGKLWHVRFRHMNEHVGRWLIRDVVEYVDSASLYSYSDMAVLAEVDPMGLYCSPAGCSSSSWTPVEQSFHTPSTSPTPSSIPTVRNGLPPDPRLAPCWTPEVAKALRQVHRTCGNIKIIWRDRAGRNRADTAPCGPCCVEIRVDTRKSDCARAIIHELQHVKDYCRYFGLCTTFGLAKLGCYDTICLELRGYSAESPGCYRNQRCRRGKCQSACGSVDNCPFDYDQCVKICQDAVDYHYCRGPLRRGRGPYFVHPGHELFPGELHPWIEYFPPGYDGPDHAY